MLRIKDENELVKLGLRLDAADPTKVVSLDGPAAAAEVLCPNCGRQVRSLHCGHCGSQLPAEQADLYGAMIRKLAKLGGNRADAGNQRGDPESQDNGDDPPKDNGSASTPQWLFDRCNELAVAACGEPITLDVAAADWNHKCERYFTQEDDALKLDWDAKAAWCNPPYTAAIIESFVRKAVDSAKHGTTTFCLLPSWNYPYLDLCEQHGQIHRICSPVSFGRQDGSVLTLNNGFHTTSLIVVVFGPTVQPGFGAPIRKSDSDKSHVGITAQAIVGGGDRRRDNDAYYTPQWAVDSLLEAEQFEGLTWEPAEGDGRIVRALRQVGCDVIGSDLTAGADFLATDKEVDNVVTNPPWGLKTEFIRRAQQCARCKVAMLLPLSALSDAARRALFQDATFPLRSVYVFTHRLNFDPKGKGSSTITAGWFVWERGYQGEPTLRWCDRSAPSDTSFSPSGRVPQFNVDWSHEEFVEDE